MAFEATVSLAITAVPKTMRITSWLGLSLYKCSETIEYGVNRVGSVTMKALIPIGLAILVSVSNIPYVYGFKKAYSENPFIFAASMSFLCGVILLVLSLFWGKIEPAYVVKHWPVIVLAAVGIASVGVLMYVIVNKYGANYFMVASLCNVIVPASVVGFLIFKEKCNIAWLVPSLICASLSVFFFAMSRPR
jgi:drug/metabolite transporter (DMT)-like permease